MYNRSRSYCALLLAYIFFHVNLVHCATTDERRVDSLNKLRGSSRRGLISMSIADFEAFLGATRSYGIVMMISTPARMCHICQPMTNELSRVSAEYYKLSSNRAAKAPLFFAELKMADPEMTEQEQMFAAKYRILRVPILYYFPPGRSPANQIEENSPYYYQVQSLGIGANAMKEFVNQRTGSRLKVVRGNYKIPFVQTVRAFKPLILLAVAMFAAISVYTGIYKSPMFWFSLVVLVYIFSVGGGHYSWINDTPLVVVNKEGKTEYIASGARTQFAAEGFFVSATCVSISVLVILIQELPSVMPNKDAQTLVGAALFLMTIFAILALLLMYQLKMPNYMTYSELS